MHNLLIQNFPALERMLTNFEYHYFFHSSQTQCFTKESQTWSCSSVNISFSGKWHNVLIRTFYPEIPHHTDPSQLNQLWPVGGNLTIIQYLRQLQPVAVILPDSLPPSSGPTQNTDSILLHSHLSFHTGGYCAHLITGFRRFVLSRSLQQNSLVLLDFHK